MKLRSQISLALVKAGYARGSKEFRNAYNRELRRKNPLINRKSWAKYYAKKMKDTNGEWNASRISEWRKSNPGDWKVIQDRCTANGVHKRFYANNKTKIIEEKKEYGKRKRREDPFFGIKNDIKSKDPGKLRIAIKKLGLIIDGLD